MQSTSKSASARTPPRAARRARLYVPGAVRVIALLRAVAPSALDWYGRRMGFAAAGGR